MKNTSLLFLLLFIASACTKQINSPVSQIQENVKTVHLLLEDVRKATQYTAIGKTNSNQLDFELMRVNSGLPNRVELYEFQQLLPKSFDDSWLSFSINEYPKHFRFNNQEYHFKEIATQQLIYETEENYHFKKQLVFHLSRTAKPVQRVEKVVLRRILPRSKKQELLQTIYLFNYNQ